MAVSRVRAGSCDGPARTIAIAVHWEGYKLGYLPRTDNLLLSILMDKGRKIEARLGGKRPRADRNEKLRIEIGMVV